MATGEDDDDDDDGDDDDDDDESVAILAQARCLTNFEFERPGKLRSCLGALPQAVTFRF